MLNFIDRSFFLHTDQSFQILVYKSDLVFLLADFVLRVELNVLCMNITFYGSDFQTVYFWEYKMINQTDGLDLWICSPNKKQTCFDRDQRCYKCRQVINTWGQICKFLAQLDICKFEITPNFKLRNIGLPARNLWRKSIYFLFVACFCGIREGLGKINKVFRQKWKMSADLWF